MGEGRLKPLSVANEYVKVMAVLALAILEPQPLAAQPHTALFEGSLRGQDRHSRHSAASATCGMVHTSALRPPLAPKKRRLLFLGLGAGSLPSLFASLLEPQNYELVAVELDAAVVTAAEQWLGLDCGRVHVETDNALNYVAACAVLDGGSFDAIFVDVFDRENAVPADFLSADFLINLRRCLTPEGFVNTFFAMLVFDPRPSTRTYGTREFETVANARMVELKWGVRRLFNPRNPSGEMTQNHVIHVTDDTPEVDPVLRYLEMRPIGAYSTKYAPNTDHRLPPRDVPSRPKVKRVMAEESVNKRV